MATTIETRSPRRKSCCGIWSVILAGLLPVLLYLLLAGVGALLIVGDPLVKSDVVVLLGGGDRQRTEEAVRIYMDRYATLLVLTETGEKDPESGELYSKLQQEEVMSLGVPQGGITFTPLHGNNTYEEALAVRDLLTSAGRVQSCIVVTDPYHTMRTRLIFREVFAGSEIKVSVRPVRGHWYRSTTWWMSRQGWDMTIREYAKLFAFFAGVRTDL